MRTLGQLLLNDPQLNRRFNSENTLHSQSSRRFRQHPRGPHHSERKVDRDLRHAIKVAHQALTNL